MFSRILSLTNLQAGGKRLPVLAVMGGGNAVATGHRCRADELSDNNRVKRGNK